MTHTKSCHKTNTNLNNTNLHSTNENNTNKIYILNNDKQYTFNQIITNVKFLLFLHFFLFFA